MTKWKAVALLCLVVNLPLKAQVAEGADLLNRAYEVWTKGKPDSALFLLNTIPQSTHRQDSLLSANVSYTKGLIYTYAANYDSAYYHLESSRKLAEQIASPRLNAMSLELLGQLFKAQDLLVRSLEYYYQAKEIYIEQEYKNDIGTILSKIGNLEGELNNHESALESHQGALEYYVNAKDSANLGLGLSNLANAQSKLARYDQAIENYYTAIDLKKKHSTERSLSFTLQYLGETYLTIQQEDSAQKYLEWSYQLKKKTEDLQGQTQVANLLSRLWLNRKNMRKSRLFIDSAYNWAVSLKSLKLQIENLEIQKDWYRQNGQSARALQLDDRFDILRDSLFQEEKLKVQKLQARYALDAKEQERQLEESRANLAEARSQQQSTLLYLSIVALVALAVLIYFIWRARQLTSEKNALLESKAVLIEQQKNDIRHRTKNHMGMVNYMLTLLKKETDNDALIKHIQSTQHLLFTFSSLETHLYDLQDEKSIDIAGYLSEWKEKFLGNLPSLDSGFEIELEADHVGVSHQHLLSIALIITELATNALKYIGMQGTATILKVSFKSNKDEMVLTVADNGPGIEDDVRQGMGWRIIHTLVKSMKAQSEAKNDQGFHFEVTIPIKKSSRA